MSRSLLVAVTMAIAFLAGLLLAHGVLDISWGSSAIIGALTALAVVGAVLWLPERGSAPARAELGTAVIVGVLVSGAIAWTQISVQRSDDARAAKSERRADMRAARDNLRVTLVFRQNLAGIDLRSAHLAGLYLRGKHLREANVRGADLHRVDLTGADLRGATDALAHQPATGKINLANATLNDVDLRDATLAKANFRHAQFAAAQLQSADLRWSNFNHATLESSDARGAFFDGAHLSDANLRSAQLADAHFDRAKIVGTTMVGAKLPRASLQNATIVRTDLRDADLRGAFLAHADLRGSDLRGAALDGADLSAVKYDDATRWPAGFDPQKHGARRVP